MTVFNISLPFMQRKYSIVRHHATLEFSYHNTFPCKCTGTTRWRERKNIQYTVENKNKYSIVC